MATLLYPGTEFRITHQEMIKGIKKCKTGMVNSLFQTELFIDEIIYIVCTCTWVILVYIIKTTVMVLCFDESNIYLGAYYNWFKAV